MRRKILSNNAEYDDYVAKATLMDDQYARTMLLHRPDVIAVMLRGILGDKAIEVEHSLLQVELTPFATRGVKLDIYAQGKDGTQYCIELQNANEGDLARRTHLISALMDASILTRGEAFKSLPNAYVIFVLQEDCLGDGTMMVRCDRTKEGSKKPLGDGCHFVFCCLKYVDTDTDAGKILHDIACPDHTKMYTQEIAKLTEFAKTTEKGELEIMIPAYSMSIKEFGASEFQRGIEKGEERGIKKGRQEGRLEGRQETELRISQRLEGILRRFDLTDDERAELVREATEA